MKIATYKILHSLPVPKCLFLPDSKQVHPCLLYTSMEIYVTPRNIGFMSLGMPVNVQVESFNYNEWGTLPGLSLIHI